MTEANDDGSVSSSQSSSSGGGGVCGSLVGSSGGGNNGGGGVLTAGSNGGGDGSAANVVTSRTVQHLVKVRAQVMMRDDSRGGWLPRGGGGLSDVSVLKRVTYYYHNHSHHHHHLRHHYHHHHHHASSAGTSHHSSSSSSQQPAPGAPQQPSSQRHHHPSSQHYHHPLESNRGSSGGGSRGSICGTPLKEFLIYGQKASDQSVVLNCCINKDFEYNKVMPTFHHWRSGEHKFGLTFQTAADARAFDKGVRQAVKELMDGLGDSTCLTTTSTASQQSSHHHHHHHPPMMPPTSLPVFPPPQPYPSSSKYDDYTPPEEEVFIAVNLPVSNNEEPSGVTLPPTSSASSPTHLSRFCQLMRPVPKAGGTDNNKPPNDGSTGDNKPDVGGDGGSIAGDISSTGGNSGNSSSMDPYIQLSSSAPPPTVPPHTRPQHLVPQSGGGGLDYHYSTIDCRTKLPSSQPQPSSQRRDSIASIKKAIQQEQLGISTTMSSAGGVGLISSNKRSTSNSSSTGSSSLGKFKFGNLSNLVKSNNGGGNGGGGSDGKPFVKQHQLSGLEERAGLKQRCRHCQESFYPKNNPKGSCEFAPDLVRSAIDRITCLECTQCMLYHCMSDEEGEYPRHPCSCAGAPTSCTGCYCCGDDGDMTALDNEMMGMNIGGGGGSGLAGMESNRQSVGACIRRWIALTVLSLFVPCLCCYLPLTACHSAFVRCGLCGGRHETYSGNNRHCSSDPGTHMKYMIGAKQQHHHHMEGKFGSRGSRSGRYSGGGSRFDAIGGS